MYFLGIIVALLMATLFKKTLLRGETPVLIMELPPYKRPLALEVLRQMWDRSKLFLYRAGTVILGINILLWFLASYPKPNAAEYPFAEQRLEVQKLANAKQLSQEASQTRLAEIDTAEAGERLRGSFAGMLGRTIEPVIAPLGLDWKIGIGLVSSFAAREVFISTMAIVYNVEQGGDAGGHSKELAEVMRAQKRADGTPLFSTLTTLSLMIFYVISLQCVSTIAIVRRETGSWKWPAFQWLYMGVLAWSGAFVLYQGGRLLGFQ
jgi:ferrous iron transport protein B